MGSTEHEANILVYGLLTRQFDRLHTACLARAVRPQESTVFHDVHSPPHASWGREHDRDVAASVAPYVDFLAVR